MFNVKNIYANLKRPNNTPNKMTPHILLADMNGLYLASIRSHSHHQHQTGGGGGGGGGGEFASPVRTGSGSSHFTNYSVSNSNSPLYASGKKSSPKFVVDTNTFVSERTADNLRSSKLLKSPSVSGSDRFSPYKCDTVPNGLDSLKVRTFAARLRSEGFMPSSAESSSGLNDTFLSPKPLLTPPPRRTPTEQEFLDMLYRNRHIPPDPCALIG